MNTLHIEEEIVRLENEIIELSKPDVVESDSLALLNVVRQHPEVSAEVVNRVQFIHSQALWLQNKNQLALDRALQIKEWAETVGNMPFLTKAYAHCGAIYRDMGIFQESLDMYTTALDVSNQTGYQELLSNIMGGLGQLYRSVHEYDKALEYLHTALQMAEDKGNNKQIASWSGTIGLIYDDISQYHKAIEYYKKALELSEQENSTASIALWSGNLGVSYQNISDYVQALKFYQKALRINQEKNKKDSIAINIGNIGNIYFCLSEYEKALEYYLRALAIHEQENHLQGIADCTGNVGNVYLQMKEYDTALEYYSRNIAINQQLGYKHGIANNTGNMGSVYMLMEEYEMALQHFNTALSLHQEVGNKHGTALWNGALGIVYAHKEFAGYQPELAEEYLYKALSLCKEEGMRKEEYEFHKSLAELYRQQSQWQEFAEHYKLYRDIEYEVITTESRRQAAQIDYEREVAEKDKQMAVERAETRVRLEEQEKLILNILPHSIAERLLRKETFIVDHYDNVSIMFLDLVHFTQIASLAPPKQLIYLLNTIFSTADTIIKKHGLEKIKTIGDAYMAVTGAPVQLDEHARRAASAACDLLDSISEFAITMPAELGDASWVDKISGIQVRIGLHCGEAIGGVIGDTKFTFDLWGDAVNTASRMESHSEAGKIHVSEEFAKELTRKDPTQTLSRKEGFEEPFSFPLREGRAGVLIERGEIEIKGKGIMRTYYLERRS